MLARGLLSLLAPQNCSLWGLSSIKDLACRGQDEPQPASTCQGLSLLLPNRDPSSCRLWPSAQDLQRDRPQDHPLLSICPASQPSSPQASHCVPASVSCGHWLKGSTLCTAFGPCRRAGLIHSGLASESLCLVSPLSLCRLLLRHSATSMPCRAWPQHQSTAAALARYTRQPALRLVQHSGKHQPTPLRSGHLSCLHNDSQGWHCAQGLGNSAKEDQPL